MVAEEEDVDGVVLPMPLKDPDLNLQDWRTRKSENFPEHPNLSIALNYF